MQASTVILHTLVIISLLAPGLAAWTPQPELVQAPRTATSRVLLSSTLLTPASELSQTLQPSATPEIESTPVSSATPEPKNPPASQAPAAESAAA